MFDKHCSNQCNQDDCQITYTITSVTESRGEKDDFRFSIFVPKEPSVVIYYIAKITLSEILIFCFSCIGTWLGLSVLTLSATICTIFRYFKIRPCINIVQVDNESQSMNLHNFNMRIRDKTEMVASMTIMKIRHKKDINRLKSQLNELRLHVTAMSNVPLPKRHWNWIKIEPIKCWA